MPLSLSLPKYTAPSSSSLILRLHSCHDSCLVFLANFDAFEDIYLIERPDHMSNNLILAY